MSESVELNAIRPWRGAVWALRAGYVALAVALAGVFMLARGSTHVVLVVGVVAWLLAAAVTLVEFLRARSQLPEPRPGLWSMRMDLIHDSVHAKPST